MIAKIIKLNNFKIYYNKIIFEIKGKFKSLKMIKLICKNKLNKVMINYLNISKAQSFKTKTITIKSTNITKTRSTANITQIIKTIKIVRVILNLT